MREFAFRLSSENLPMSSPAGLRPGVRRMRIELAKRGSLGRSFDNKCAHESTTSGVVLGNGAPPR